MNAGIFLIAEDICDLSSGLILISGTHPANPENCKRVWYLGVKPGWLHQCISSLQERQVNKEMEVNERCWLENTCWRILQLTDKIPPPPRWRFGNLLQTPISNTTASCFTKLSFFILSTTSHEITRGGALLLWHDHVCMLELREKDHLWSYPSCVTQPVLKICRRFKTPVVWAQFKFIPRIWSLKREAVKRVSWMMT